MTLGAALAVSAIDAPAGHGYRLYDDGLGGKGTVTWPKKGGRAPIPFAFRGKRLRRPVKLAVRRWNASGARIRFKQVSWRRAKLRIGYGPTYGNCGLATRSWQSSHDGRARAPKQILPWHVHMNRAACGPRADRNQVAFTMAHELGHILGLDHEPRRCSVMQTPAVARWDLRVGAKYVRGCKPPRPGRWFCQLITRDDVRGALKLYGGRRRKPRKPCLLFPEIGRLPAAIVLELEGAYSHDFGWEQVEERWSARFVLRRGKLEDSPTVRYVPRSGTIEWTVEASGSNGCETRGSRTIDYDRESSELAFEYRTRPRRNAYLAIADGGLPSSVQVPATRTCPPGPAGEEGYSESYDHQVDAVLLQTGLERGDLRRRLTGERTQGSRSGDESTTWKWTITPQRRKSG